MTTEHGRILSVQTHNLGDECVGGAALGESTIPVDDVADFSEEGGWISSPAGIQQYSTIDDTAQTITLTGTLASALTDGDRVDLWEPGAGSIAQETVASVLLDGADINSDPLEALIPQALVPLLPEGIRTEPGESVTLELGADGDWTVADVPGRTPTLAGSLIDTLELDPVGLDGFPPAQVTTVGTVPALRNIFLKWAPVLFNNQGGPQRQVVIYKVYAHSSSPVPEDDSHLVGQTSSTFASVSSLADGSQLQVFTDSTNTTHQDYFFKVTATDEDGAGLASPEATAQLDQNGTGDIAVGSITAALLQSVLVLGSTITTRAQDPTDPSGQTLIGPGITLTPTSLIAYDASGRKTLEVQPNQSPSAVFRGDAEIDHLTVLTLTTLQESILSQGSTMTLQSTVADPTNPPAAAVDWQTTGYADDGAWTKRYGWTISPSGTYAFSSWKDTGSGVWRMERWNLSTKTRTHNILPASSYTTANKVQSTAVYADSDTTAWYLEQYSAAAGGASNKWHLRKIDFSTSPGTVVTDLSLGAGVAGTVAIDYTAAAAATFDGTNWVIWWQTSAFHLVYQYGTPSGSNLANVGSVIDSGRVLGAAADISSVNLTQADFGAGNTRYVVTYRNSVSSPYATCFVFDISGVEQTTEEWTRRTDLNYSIGSWWDTTAGKWKTMQQGSVVTYETGGNYWKLTSPTWWIAYAWTNGATSTRLVSTPFGVGMTKRARITVTTPALPAGVTGADIYFARGTTAPATTGVNYKRQGAADVTDPSQPKLTIPNALWTANDNPITSGFGTGVAARLKSEGTSVDDTGVTDETIELFGDGSGRVGPLEWDTSGRRLQVYQEGIFTGTNNTPTTTPTALPNPSLTIRSRGTADVFAVDWVADVGATSSAPVGTCTVSLAIDGTKQTVPQLVVQHTAANQRVTAHQHMLVTGLAAGTHTLTLMTELTAGGANYLVRVNHTTLHAERKN